MNSEQFSIIRAAINAERQRLGSHFKYVRATISTDLYEQVLPLIKADIKQLDEAEFKLAQLFEGQFPAKGDPSHVK